MTTTLFHYLYRDADNYKASGVIALSGKLDDERWKATLTKFEEGTWFVAEQLDVPTLYHILYQYSGGPTSADHCWHEFVELEVTGDHPPDMTPWGSAEEFSARVLAVRDWHGELSPNFLLDA